MFYNNVKSLFQKIKFLLHQIWNVDKTGMTTVHIPENVIAKKGEGHILAVTSFE